MDANGNHSRKQAILKIVGDFLPEWQKVNPDEVKLQRMAGITNETYKVSHPHIEPSLIYREFGDATDNIFLDRETEEFVYSHISHSKAGPRVFGLNDGMRIQEFIPSAVLKTQQMLTSSMVQDIAFALRRFHEVAPKNPKVKKQSLFSQFFIKNGKKILEKCWKKMKMPIFTEEEQKILQQAEKWVSEQEIQFLKQATQKVETCELVFSHNDLLAGNVLIREGDDKIIFIDYEYSCYNYRAYDIANYFNESVIDYNVTETPFFKIRQSTKQEEEMKGKLIKCYALAEQQDFDQYKKSIANCAELTETGKKVYQEIKEHLLLCEMISSLMWGYWSIIVSKNPAIDFDYIKFCQYRHEVYQKMKKQLLARQKK